MLNRYEKYFSVFIIFIIIFIVISIVQISLGISLIVISDKIKSYEEIPPQDRDIYGIGSFNFEKNNDPVEYVREIAHLGETGTPSFDCYSGTCIGEEEEDDDDYYYYYYKSLFFTKNNFTNTSTSNNIMRKNLTKEIKDFRYIYFNEIDYQCSRDCAINQKEYCLCSRGYYPTNGTCDYRERTSYNISKFCYSNDIIFKWKGYLYNRTLLTYSYIQDVILPNETCPSHKKLCGVLDENGHKLCLPLDKRCPINRIAVNKIPSDGYNYTSVKIDNITLYYTNEAIKDGRIIKSIMADSTINILNDCEILDIIPLKDLMEYNRNIYSEQKNIITSEDKAYLKWCPAFNYGLTDLTKKREEYKIYLNIKNINEYIVKPLNDNKDNNDANIAKFMGTVIHIIGLYLFASTLIRKYKRKNTGEHCMDTFGGLNLFGILYGFPCIALAAFSLEYHDNLKGVMR